MSNVLDTPYFESVQEIKDAVETGKTVYWQEPEYVVTRTLVKKQWLVRHLVTGVLSPLTNGDGSLNGNLADFHQKEMY